MKCFHNYLVVWICVIWGVVSGMKANELCQFPNENHEVFNALIKTKQDYEAFTEFCKVSIKYEKEFEDDVEVEFEKFMEQMSMEMNLGFGNLLNHGVPPKTNKQPHTYERLCTFPSDVHIFLLQSGDLDFKKLNMICGFLKVQGKIYKDVNEVKYRMNVVHRNQAIVDKLNSLQIEAEYSVGSSPFGDLTTEEFAQVFLAKTSLVHHDASLYESQILKYSSTEKSSSNSNLRSEEMDPFDWRDKNMVTEVKNQGSLGTCWAFSAIGVLESQMGIAKNNLMDLSVEQLVECSNEYNNTSGEADCSEFGGWPYLGFKFLKEFGGVYSDTEFPYCSGTLDKRTLLPACYPCMPKAYDEKSCGDHSDLYCDTTTTLGQRNGGLCEQKNKMEKPVAKVSGWKQLPTEEKDLAESLKELGPVSVALDAISLQFYFRGVITLPICRSKADALNHAVILTGYGEKTSLLGNPLPFWNVKNSWGTSWGEQGYFRLKRGTGLCGINLKPTIGFVE